MFGDALLGSLPTTLACKACNACNVTGNISSVTLIDAQRSACIEDGADHRSADVERRGPDLDVELRCTANLLKGRAYGNDVRDAADSSTARDGPVCRI
jgi:hypothetical protein